MYEKNIDNLLINTINIAKKGYLNFAKPGFLFEFDCYILMVISLSDFYNRLELVKLKIRSLKNILSRTCLAVLLVEH